MASKPDASLTEYGQAKVLSRPSSSPLADAYETDKFINDWSNDIRFHVARNLLHLRRHRRMSQVSVARAVGTSQSAIARIESAQENITLDTLRRVITVLKGRFYVSIPPQEFAPRQMHPWWEAYESITSNPWNLCSYVARRTERTDQVVLGLERRHDQGLSGSTLLPGAMMLLPPANTGRQEYGKA